MLAQPQNRIKVGRWQQTDKRYLTLRYLDGTQRKYVVTKHVKHTKSATWCQWDDRLRHVLENGLVVYQCQVEPARRRSCVVCYDHSKDYSTRSQMNARLACDGIN